MTWAYDGWGDRSSQRISEGSLEWPQDAYSFSANNQIEQDSYDAAGNETYDGFHTYAYDDEGRIAAVDGGGTAQYVYDADGLRVHKTGGEGPEDFVYDLGGRAVATYSSTNGGWVRGEIYAGAMHVGTYGNSTTYFSSTDWQGTERVRSDVNGNSVESCSDLAFGDDQNCTGSDPSPLHLTGKMRDTETGLDYFGARYYASNAGRWMLPDWSAVPEPVPYADLSNPQTLNLYTYVGNNPINGIDADGHSSDGNNGQPCGWYGTTGSAPGSVVTPAQVPCSAPDNGPYSADNGEGQEWANDTAQAAIEGLANSLQGLQSLSTMSLQAIEKAANYYHYDVTDFENTMTGSGARNGIDPNMLVGLAYKESSLDPFSTNGGLFQIQPSRAKDLGIAAGGIANFHVQIPKVAAALSSAISTLHGNLDLGIASWTLGVRGTQKLFSSGGMQSVRGAWLDRNHHNFGQVGPNYIDVVKGFEP